MLITVSCIVCRQGSHFDNYERAQANGYINYNGAWFCSKSCLEKFLAKQNGGGNGSGSSDGASSGGDSSGSTGGDALGAGIGLAAAGAGAAVAGVGAAVKGIGSLIGGIGKGAGAMGDLMKDGVNQSKMNTKIAQEMMDYKFSDNPETYKKEISDMYATAMMKASFPPNPLEWSKQTYAKKRLCQEFESMARTNPSMYADYAQQHEILKKKKSAWTNFIIGAGIFLIVFCVLLPMIAVSASSGKSKKETARLEAIVKEIDDAIAAKDYDTALYKATKLQWIVEPGSYWREREQWDKRREELTATIEKLSGKSSENPAE
ncbi:hypothetical protein [Treponema sp.]|uniref:hypothetical protein n=1 Tax=Treponema sp. TaxID=166 RepID=UPI00257C2F2A|nr:hypothetical protein [Treponema sp.]